MIDDGSSDLPIGLLTTVRLANSEASRDRSLIVDRDAPIIGRLSARADRR